MARRRLLEPMLAGRLVVIEAAAGSGKSVLAAQLREALGVATPYVRLDPADSAPPMFVSSLRRALRAARLSDLVAMVGAGSGGFDPTATVDQLLEGLAQIDIELLFVFDDAHHLGEDAGTLLVRLAGGLPAPHRLLICSRRLAGRLGAVVQVEGVHVFDSRDLAFTGEEAASLVERRGGERPAADDVALLLEATDGWATALVLAATAGGDATPVGHRDGGRSLIAASLRRIVEPLSEGQRRALVWLAHLPLISSALADALAGETSALAALVAAGVPFARNGSGWWELPAPIADLLVAHGPLTARAAQLAADAYLQEGELVLAVRLLVACGLTMEAAALVERSGRQAADELGFAGLRELVEQLPDDAVVAHPRVLLLLARVAEATHERAVRTSALDRAGLALQAAGSEAPHGVALELDAELAREEMWDSRTRSDARARAESVLERAGEDQLVARARALDVLGRIDAWWSESGPLPEAEPVLRESARLARRLGEPTWAAQALVPLAIGCLVGTCRYGRAVEVLDEALAELPARSPYRVNVLSFRASALTELGRYAEAEACVAQVRSLARVLREAWMFAYAWWCEADLASRQGDRSRTVAAIVAAEEHRDAWFDQTPGVEFLAEAADHLDRSGEHDLARNYLERARVRAAGHERVMEIYEAAVLGRSGDPTDGRRAIEAVLAGAAADPHERWPLLVLRAFAALRGGDGDSAQLAAEAFETCLRLGHPDGPLLRERAVAERLLPIAAEAGSQAASALLERGGTVQIRVLGGFEAWRAGRPIELPPGRPAKAVRAVAVAGGRLHAEALTELLWPDAPPGVGRNRLRNLLSRLRAASGDVLVREGDSIALTLDREVDAERFEADARVALAAGATGNERRAHVLGQAALARYEGDLLPEDRYEQWAVGPRERLRGHVLELLDMLAAAAQRNGEWDEAARLLERALETEPYDEPRYVRLAQLLASQGRVGSALTTLRRARVAQSELGLEPSSALVELEGTLRRRWP